MVGLLPGSVEALHDVFLSTVHPADRARVDETVRRSFASGEPFAFDHRIVRPDGTERWLQARGRVVMGPQGRWMVGTGQDVTEQRRTAEAGRAFLANAAHELRTPLTSVMGLIDLIAAVGRTASLPLLDEYREMLRKQGVQRAAAHQRPARRVAHGAGPAGDQPPARAGAGSGAALGRRGAAVRRPPAGGRRARRAGRAGRSAAAGGGDGEPVPERVRARRSLVRERRPRRRRAHRGVGRRRRRARRPPAAPVRAVRARPEARNEGRAWA
jgi:PAS domain-containing protein